MCENMLVSCVENKRNEGVSWLWDSTGTKKAKRKLSVVFGLKARVAFGLRLVQQERKKIYRRVRLVSSWV